ncbi:solute carrier family 26 member 11 [Phyllostomus discolor]|uniref:Solute carrier family 26 member 11 n=1 Tax=Phyllostomus discolor TaxID=89673 RepID=A0A833ZQX0_9CHIR|nr:solute carrier family 26 member 11 [Phyllostomus discolor]
MSSSLKAMDRATPWPPGLAPMACCCSRATLQKWLPILAWLPDYSMQWLKMDLIAGLSVGLTVIPQALAYAEVAGLPAQYGLYSAFMGCFVYLLLGTSRDVTLGPTAIMSLLVSSYTFHEPAYAVLLAFLSGCIQLAMSFLGLGILLDFISCPVIKGFTSAAAITIAFGQIKNLLGLQHVPRQFFLQVYHTFRNIGQTRPGDVVLGMVCMLLLVMLKLMRGHVPPSYHDMPTSMRVSCGLVWTASTARNALVVSFAALIAYSFEVTGCQPFILTGKIVEGLPPLQVPPFSLSTANGTVSFTEMVQDMGAGLAVVPLMGLLESIAVARSFASQNSYRINTNQELLSIGRHHHSRGAPGGHLRRGHALAREEAGPAAPGRDLPAVLLGGAVRHPGRDPGVHADSPVLRGQTQDSGAGRRGAGADSAADQRPALPLRRGPPEGGGEPGSGSVAPAVRHPGVQPRLQHGRHRGAGAQRADGGLRPGGRHPGLRRPAGVHPPSPAGRRPEGRLALPHHGSSREVPESGAGDPALQRRRRVRPRAHGGPAEGLRGTPGGTPRCGEFGGRLLPWGGRVPGWLEGPRGPQR